MKKGYFWVIFKTGIIFPLGSYDCIKTKKGSLQKENMHFRTIFITPYLLVVEVEMKSVNLYFFIHMNRRLVANGFLSLVICQPRPQRIFMTWYRRKDLSLSQVMLVRWTNSVNLYSLDIWMVSFLLLFVWQECKDNRCQFLNQYIDYERQLVYHVHIQLISH